MMSEQVGEVMTSNAPIPAEVDLSTAYDSRLFGFMTTEGEEGAQKKAMLNKAIAQLEQEIKKKEVSDPKIYCKLGHYHLLLGEYSKALSAYQKFFTLDSEYWKDATFLYGLGMVYFHFSAYQW
ncbi:histone demethylase UTY-like [Lytechinus pictus]|uniref:histone demethylase UTY-like n=1 Tax=Lytechinus pictus TaxID=7653 RepID=UPI001BB1E594|nr:histone demethylase UTY-like isoform X2 [Lytechinus variegatus]XP_054770585.1 histone demethylase UTY-like [Lytechinus pictus]